MNISARRPITQAALIISVFFGAHILVPSLVTAQTYQDTESLIPKCTLSANPVLIYSPYTTTLNWTTQNATSVSISDVGAVAPSGQTTISNIYNDRTFVLTATNAYGTRTCTIQVFSKDTPTGAHSTTYTTQQYPAYYYNNPIYSNQNGTQNNAQYYSGNAYGYGYANTNGTQYTQNGYTYYNTGGSNQVVYGTPYGQTPAPTYNTNTHQANTRTVRLSRLPYTGPVEDMVTGFFSLAVLTSSLYGMRRLVG